MTPQEVENYIENMYIGPITNRPHFYNQVAQHLGDYESFAAFTYPYVDGQTCNLEDDDGDFQKIGYVKARVAARLWTAYGGSYSDPGYIGALQLILRNCRLTDNARRNLAQVVAVSPSLPGNSATSATFENTMNNISAQAFVTTTTNFVYGRDIKTLSDAELISAIKGVEAEIKELGKIESSSTKIAAKVDELKAMLASIVAALDASK